MKTENVVGDTFVRVTTERLRAMPENKPEVFLLRDAAAINAAKSLAYHQQRLLRCHFTAKSDYNRNTLTLTKRPMVKP